MLVLKKALSFSEAGFRKRWLKWTPVLLSVAYKHHFTLLVDLVAALTQSRKPSFGTNQLAFSQFCSGSSDTDTARIKAVVSNSLTNEEAKWLSLLLLPFYLNNSVVKTPSSLSYPFWIVFCTISTYKYANGIFQQAFIYMKSTSYSGADSQQMTDRCRRRMNRWQEMVEIRLKIISVHFPRANFNLMNTQMGSFKYKKLKTSFS